MKKGRRIVAPFVTGLDISKFSAGRPALCPRWTFLALSAAISAEKFLNRSCRGLCVGLLCTSGSITPSNSNTGKIILINKVVWVHKSRDSGAKGQYAKIPKMTRNGSGRHLGGYNYRQLCTLTFRKPMPLNSSLHPAAVTRSPWLHRHARPFPEPLPERYSGPHSPAPPPRAVRTPETQQAPHGTRTGTVQRPEYSGLPAYGNELFIGQGQELQFVGEILDQLAVEQVQHPVRVPVGSSARISLGLATSARAMATRCC